MKKLAIITTHPIQYHAPWFRLLHERRNIAMKVFYTWSQVETEEKFDPGFEKNIEWDIPLLEGYDYTFVKNISKSPGSKTYAGINNPSLIKVLHEWKPDAILVFGWKFKSHLKVMRYFHGKVPVLFRGDSTLLSQHRGLRFWLKFQLLKRIYKNVNIALYVGEENKKYFESAGLKAKQLVYAPHAIDNNRFLDTVFDPTENNGKDTVFLFAGKFEEIKNLHFLIETFLSGGFENAQLMLVGKGPLEEDLVKKFRAKPNIIFCGFRNQKEMPSVYRIADVFVLASKSETWGLAVNEAMAAGAPVLVSDKCGCAVDLVENGKSGYVFTSNDGVDLKNKMTLMASDKAKLKEMGKYAFEKIQDWSFEKIVMAIEDIVNREAATK